MTTQPKSLSERIRAVSIAGFDHGWSSEFIHGVDTENARLQKLVKALAECADCLDELAVIIDGEHLDEVDSFTVQPAHSAMKNLERVLDEMEGK